MTCPPKKESSYNVSLEGHGDAPFAIIARANGSRAVTLGGDRGIRTPNLCDANAALSQLSYIPSNSILAKLKIQGQAS
jgi:hypothetical protein